MAENLSEPRAVPRPRLALHPGEAPTQDWVEQPAAPLTAIPADPAWTSHPDVTRQKAALQLELAG